MIVLSMLPMQVFAHATPITYTPAAGASETSTPQMIAIYFSERIEPDASSIKVLGPDGKSVALGAATLAEDDPRRFVVAVSNAGDGIYTALWQVVSVDDGHFTKGSFSFLVSSSGEQFTGNAESVQVIYVTRISEAFLHTLGLIGESIFIGVLLVYAWVIRPYFKGVLSPAYTSAARATENILGYVMLGGGFVFVLSTLVVYIKKSIELGGLRDDSFLTASALFFSSASGGAMVIKMILGLLIAGMWYFFRRRIFAAPRLSIVEGILFCFVVVLIFLQSYVSHAAASFFYPILSVAITIFHLFFKELLVGGIFVQFLFFGVLYRYGLLHTARRASLAYDQLVALAIFCGGTSGAYITWLHLKRFENLFRTEWGERFVLLLIWGGIFSCFLLLRQFYLTPRLTRTGTTFSLLRFCMVIEIACGIMLLFYSAYISITTPPFLVEQFAYHSETRAQDLVVHLEQHPLERDMLRVRFVSLKGDPVPADSLTVVLGSGAYGIEGNVVSPQARGIGSYVIPKSAFTPSGSWNVALTAQHAHGYDTRAAFTLTMPDDVVATRYSDEVRSMDRFAKILMLVALALALGSCGLLLYASMLKKRVPQVSQDPCVAQTPFPLMGVSVVAVFILVALVFGIHGRLLTSSLESACLAQGFAWKQALPARDMEVVSPNATLGCFMHDGHYHLADPAEFDFVVQTF